MASTSAPRILAFLAGGAITKGSAVKMGADRRHVVVAAAATDKQVGIAQNDATLAEDTVEVAIPGGGGKAKCSGTVAAGDFMTAGAAGTLGATTLAANRYIALAMEDGVVGDIIAVEVVAGLI